MQPMENNFRVSTFNVVGLSTNRKRAIRRRVRFGIALIGILAAPMAFAGTPNVKAVGMTIASAEAGMKAGRFTSQDLTEAFLKRIDTYNPTYRAIITMNPNALSEARVQDQRRENGDQLGRLAGIPVVVKDTMDMAGLPTTAGWAPLSRRAGGVSLIPAWDSPVVRRLLAAGAVILGKTNLPPFSVSGDNTVGSWAGSTLNAAAPDRMPGGSSAGTATAVAGSFAVVGLGEETGGSIQNPAAAEGLVGIKPTFGLVPNVGVVPLGGSTRDVVGPIASNVRDAALVLDVLAGYTPEDPKTVASIGHVPSDGYESLLGKVSLRGKRIGLFGPGWMTAPLSPDTQKLYNEVIVKLKEMGAIVVRDPFAGTVFASLAKPTGDWQYDQRGEESVAYDLNLYLEHLGPSAAIHSLAELVFKTGQNPFAEGNILGYERAQPEFLASLADPTRPPPLQNFLALREHYLAVFNSVMNQHHLDALVFPQALYETPRVNSTAHIIATTVSQVNIAGLPLVCVPAGAYPSGSPFGIVFVGRMWDEQQLLALAYDWERHMPPRVPPTLRTIQDTH